MTSRIRYTNVGFLTSGCGLLVVILAVTSGYGSPNPKDPLTITSEPLKLVVQGYSSGASDEKSTTGLVMEITHWLQYSPRTVVRSARRKLVEKGNGSTSPVALQDVDYIVWIELRQESDGFEVLWNLETVSDRSSLPSRDRPPVRGTLPELPREIAKVVLDELGVENRGASSIESLSAADPAAYEEFLKLLAAPNGSSETTLRQRVETLEELQSRLGNYTPAVTALGTAYLDLAGLVGGLGPYYEKATHALAHAFELNPGYPPARAKLASLFAKLGRSEDAIELLVNGLATHPNYPAFHETLGYVLRYS